MEFTVSAPVSSVSATVESHIDGTYSDTYWVNVTDSYTISVEFNTSLPDQQLTWINFTGDLIESFIVRGLEGDCDFDKYVTTADVSSITGRLGMDPVTVGCQYDIDCDYYITTADSSSVTGRLGNNCP